MNTQLLHTDGQVLAAVDLSEYAASVADHAAWAAERLGAGLTLLHVHDRESAADSRDLSGSLALGASEDLLAELATLDGQRAALAQKQARALLDTLAVRTSERGVTAAAQQRHGALVDTLLECEPGVRLFVIGKRGESADHARGHLGAALERVVRAVHRPVLVASRAFRPIERFLIAFDGSPTTRKCVEMVCASPLLKGAACHLVMAGSRDEAQRAHLQWAEACLREAGFEPSLHTADGSAESVIAAHADSTRADLLVMGAYGHSRIRTLLVGSTTTQVLRQCKVPVLLLR